jgi:hypothetical protein
VRLTDLQRAERELVRSYYWRTRRYRRNSFGTSHGGGNALNEENAAAEIAALEARVESLGGDTRGCLERGRAMADKKENA